MDGTPACPVSPRPHWPPSVVALRCHHDGAELTELKKVHMKSLCTATARRPRVSLKARPDFAGGTVHGN